MKFNTHNDTDENSDLKNKMINRIQGVQRHKYWSTSIARWTTSSCNCSNGPALSIILTGPEDGPSWMALHFQLIPHVLYRGQIGVEEYHQNDVTLALAVNEHYLAKSTLIKSGPAIIGYAPPDYYTSCAGSVQ
ncbi:hypothetical protein TNCV_1694011 [Trichonephila clavipes]|nr:hypothetical protein TNCV_1694011 [Trichonephila clavipes]